MEVLVLELLLRLPEEGVVLLHLLLALSTSGSPVFSHFLDPLAASIAVEAVMGSATPGALVMLLHFHDLEPGEVLAEAEPLHTVDEDGEHEDHAQNAGLSDGLLALGEGLYLRGLVGHDGSGQKKENGKTRDSDSGVHLAPEEMR